MRSFISFALSVLFTFSAAASELFPFVILDDAPKNATDISHKLDAPAGKHGFVRNGGGHFVTDAGRIQFWGTNTCFGANFLKKEDCNAVAERLARFGINCVRLHHIDYHHIWHGGAGEAKTLMTFDKEQLDKLDYYIFALKKRGIYVNLNLHVSRHLDERDGFPKRGLSTNYNKGVDNYYEPFIEADKRYARDLLNHVNPYTGNAYKDEPSIAMVEINNENSIISMWGGWGGLAQIQDPFLADLTRRWNQFLKTKYKTDAALENAWDVQRQPYGKEFLKLGKDGKSFPKNYTPNGDCWTWEVDKNNETMFSNRDGVLIIKQGQKGENSWRPLLIAGRLHLKKGQVYTASFKIKADKATKIFCGIAMNHDPWKGLGFSTELRLTTDWQEFQYSFTPEADDENARFAFGGFEEKTKFEINYVSLREGGNLGLAAETSLAKQNIPLVWKNEAKKYPKQTVNDFCDFLFEIEEKYFLGMFGYLKNKIGVKQLVAGTQLNYGSPHTQAKLDYCDMHNYWQHPSFPGKAWDGANWYVHNKPLVPHLDESILPELATHRIWGKPHTISEYNHPYPNQYGAEGFLILSAFGAFQDWDGVFSFAYSHSDQVRHQRCDTFFDLTGNSVQLAHQIACRNFFCEGIEKDVKPVLVPFSVQKERQLFYEHLNPYCWGFRGAGLDKRNALLFPCAVDISGKTRDLPQLAEIPKDKETFVAKKNGESAIRFDVHSDKSSAAIRFETASAWTGFVQEGKKHPFADGTLELGRTNLGWAAVSLAEVRSGTFLLAATGEMRNTEMNIRQLDGDKITVGNQWGNAPVCCEGIPAKIVLPLKSSTKCWALDSSGKRKTEVPVKQTDDGKVSLELKPEYQTIWYEICPSEP
jgi:hypothetical protein